MRRLDDGLAAHLASGATTLVNCWRIARPDGVTLGFTDHDETLNFDGTAFAPAHGLDASERTAKLGAQVDTSEVTGLIHAEAVTEADILLGRYDGATVETWRVNWLDVNQRALMRRDTVGEITREDGVFRLELRSAQHALNVAKGKVYQALCGTSLGAAPCGIDIDRPEFRTTATITDLRGRQVAAVELLAGFASRWFDYGTAAWLSGRRTGKTDRIVRQIQFETETVITFAEPIEDWAAPGDTLTLHAGCDRRFATCRKKFSNTANFRGFPHIPGNDFVLRYPRPGTRFGGEPLVT